MRLLHLFARLGGRQHLERDTVIALAASHPSLVATGRGTCPALSHMTSTVDGLQSASPVSVADALDALAKSFAPDRVIVHSGVNPLALRWVAERGGIVNVADPRAFFPQGALGLRDDTAARASGKLCVGCFDTEPYLRRRRDESRLRVEALRGASVVLVGSSEEASLVRLLDEDAPVRVLPRSALERAAFLEGLLSLVLKPVAP